MKKYLIILSSLVLLAFTSCQEEELGPSIFDVDIPVYDSALATGEFDKYLYEHYVQPYNLDFRYRMRDVGSDTQYNLVPAKYNKAIQLAVLTEYLWFDVYGTVVEPDFLKQNGPRIIFLVGSPAYNPEQGTETLGTAEGGIKVTLYKVNEMIPTNIAHLNEYFFHTMHHEFCHILHQKISYPPEFDAISAGKYSPTGWQNRTDEEAQRMGFVTNYASCEGREDFVEVISNYITETDEDWNNMLETAATGQVSASETGKDVIMRKFDMAKNWLQNSWNIDLEALRKEVQSRQDSIGSNIKYNGQNTKYEQLMINAGFEQYIED